MALSAAPPAGPRGPTAREEYGSGSPAPEKTTIALDSPHDRHINHVRDGAGSEVLSHRLTSLLPSLGVRQTGPSAVKVSMYYISRTRSWAKPTIWLPSPPIGLIIHTGAQLHGEPRGVCSRSIITFRTEVVLLLGQQQRVASVCSLLCKSHLQQQGNKRAGNPNGRRRLPPVRPLGEGGINNNNNCSAHHDRTSAPGRAGVNGLALLRCPLPAPNVARAC